ncbi:hypothetical protein [Agrobacterium tumefaciens]|uniref:Uncharacterized protein n=1 Tax=Agrobacterium tumefaciens TaxID=358 RepID=A0AA44JBL8_AGRTU|nr:hypothetical protein [Agrobacterium tumefaciens]NTB86841.1 hypothetical protein [Agrobacterium tumefaciens]NTC21170.1 hypothetical protein [Agrobacterium tumefaciens]NTC30718.1 hypothetical protein [Agrobacterium tumefaciens]
MQRNKIRTLQVTGAALTFGGAALGFFNTIVPAVGSIGTTTDSFVPQHSAFIEALMSNGERVTGKFESTSHQMVLEGVNRISDIITRQAEPRPITTERDWYPVYIMRVTPTKSYVDGTAGQIKSMSPSGLTSFEKSADQKPIVIEDEWISSYHSEILNRSELK